MHFLFKNRRDLPLFSSTLLSLSDLFLKKSIKVLIVRDFGDTTYMNVKKL
jgi:hypothetical protein